METNRIFQIDKSIPESSHTQVLKQLKLHLHLGRLRSGDRLPSVRKLADVLGVNPKTAHSIYHYLEYEGLVEIRPNSGVFVNGGKLAKQQAHRAVLAVKVRRLIREACSLGFTRDELWDLLEGCFGSNQAPELLGVVECNQEFCHLICRDLMRELHVNVVPICLEELSDRASERLAGLRFLITTEYHLSELRSAVGELGIELYGVRLNYRIFEDLEGQLTKGRVLFLVKEPCFIKELEALLKKVLSPAEVDNFIGLTCEDQFLVCHWLKRVRSVYISPTCPPSLGKWIMQNRPDDVTIKELSRVVSASSLKELKDVLFFARGSITQEPVSRYAFGKGA